MLVSAWSDGRDSVYGLRILGNGRSLYFREEWESVLLFFPDIPEPATIRLTPSFWGTCPQLRGRPIRSFLRRNGFIPWPRDHPPHFDLQPLGGGRFRLRWLEHRPVQPTLGLFEEPSARSSQPACAEGSTSEKDPPPPAADGGTLGTGEES